MMFYTGNLKDDDLDAASALLEMVSGFDHSSLEGLTGVFI